MIVVILGVALGYGLLVLFALSLARAASQDCRPELDIETELAEIVSKGRPVRAGRFQTRASTLAGSR